MNSEIEKPMYPGFTNLETYSIAMFLEHCEELQEYIDGCKNYMEVVEKLTRKGHYGNEFGVELTNSNLNIMQLDRVVRDITGI